MNAAPYQLLRFERKGPHIVCVPWPQVLAWRWRTAGAEDQIEFRLSIGTIRVSGRKLHPLWSAFVSQQADRLAEGPREDGVAIRIIEFDFAEADGN